MPSRRASRAGGLPALRRSGTVTELLFLYECTTREPTQLRPIAETLGLTVQAASHSFRRLAERGFAEFRDGQYRPTVKGVAWLHETFGELVEDLGERGRRLHVIRSCRAIARTELRAGEAVSLVLTDGLLGAERGARGPSRGIASTSARAGELVTVGSLEGILPVSRGLVHVYTVEAERLNDRMIRAELRAVAVGARGLLAAPSLEPYHLLTRVTHRPILQFGVAPSCREAARVGVDSTVVLLAEELPRFLEQFHESDPPPLTISRLGERESGGPGRRLRG